MSANPFVGQIEMFTGNFAPSGWAFCNGQLMAVSENDALFSILGTIYGGDGRTTFGLPDLRGRLPMHPGNGPGLTPRRLGQKGGLEQNYLTTNQLPSHNHGLRAKEEGNTDDPNGNVVAGSGTQSFGTASDATMNNTAISNTGGGLPVNNMQPFECANFVIALFGVYPSRS
ncbi:phage tail protein [Lutibacter flavus]|uniref:Microcystin-dependent protein n=1 Tax=Lutibacter flavus TaxID=691689 RepID=A0A238Z5R8_9FLAO|nr:tail fiber protein [Lutibacter flavus]SNR78318.1 Microcystin-dependent protein [Lutibacter flavus]